MNPKVSIIILNWNGWKDTIECLESVYQINYTNYDIIVLDNGSNDDSIKKIRKYCEGQIKVKSEFFDYNSSTKPIKLKEYTKKECENGNKIKIKQFSKNKEIILIKNDKNYGFAGGNNIGIDFALKNLSPHYILLLNNDTVVDKKLLTELITVTESNKNIGIAGPTTYYYDKPNKINFAGGIMNFNKGESYHLGYNKSDHENHSFKEVDYVEGSCFLIKEELIENIGTLNEKYFAYWEETDLCMRAKNANYTLVYVPRAEIWHKMGNNTENISKLREFYLTRNMFWFMKEHASKQQYMQFILYFFGFKLWFRIGTLMLHHKSWKGLTAFLKGIIIGVIT